jgi:hypothetical protein
VALLPLPRCREDELVPELLPAFEALVRVCFFSPYSEHPCDGPRDRCHLIPKQRIKREWRSLGAEDLKKLVWHRSVWVWGCRRHHGDFDNKALRVPRSRVPAVTWSFAEQFGLTWSLDRDFPPDDL